MAIEILEHKGIFEIFGTLRAHNLGALQIYFDLMIEKYDDLVIRLDRLEELDVSAALYLEKLHEKARSMNKRVTLVSQENPEVERILLLTGTLYLYTE
ncbi:STAS domain-containing protein [Aureicoccus marinus]|uniref:STAS domain-containing protein n=1 Tax=Aureicoccus marinus TaxID=754435 RepID=A0A2S7T8Y0_9FLAO|nr:STAS domain-containing protein [Aureicoccus marinus]PQJ15916.1 hypothetical protein BST99_09430 [Aureicoccus marinus]